MVDQEPPQSQENINTEEQRQKFLNTVISPEVRNSIVMRAFEKVDRYKFVPDEHKGIAYKDTVVDLQVGKSSISEPSLVAKMIDSLNPKPNTKKILQVGTGSGFDTAVLCNCAQSVFSIECDQTLAESAHKRLIELGYTNFQIIVGDGMEGLLDEAPFDGIIITASAKSIPNTLIKQLEKNCRIVIPVGKHNPSNSFLILGEKSAKGSFSTRSIGRVDFVPIISPYEGGWKEEELLAVEKLRQDQRKQEIDALLSQTASGLGLTEEQMIEVFREKFGYDTCKADLHQLIVLAGYIEELRLQLKSLAN